MPDPYDHKAFLTLVELAIANMYEVEAFGELLEQKGLFTKNEIITLAKTLKQKSISPDPNNTSPRDPPQFTAQENAVIEELMAVILQQVFLLTKPRRY